MSMIENKTGRKKMMSAFVYLRIFTVFAILVSGLVDLYDAGIFDTPVEQIGVGALAGLAGTFALKAAHII